MNPTAPRADSDRLTSIDALRGFDMFWIMGADSRAEKSLYELKFDMNVGVVIGSEGKGVRPLLLKKCDYTVSIPMKGKVSSLNAGIAGAVILFEVLRQQIAQNV